MPHEKETMSLADSAHGFEQEDISLKVVGTCVAVLLAALVMAVFALAPLFEFRKSEHAISESLLRPLSTGFDASAKFPQPRLQPQPKLDLETFRRQEDRILDTYGWEDRARGIVRVPIAIAMDRLLKRGLSTRGEAHAR